MKRIVLLPLLPVVFVLAGCDVFLPSNWQNIGANADWQDPPSGSVYTLAQATQYCIGLSLNGHTDWRLPTIDELRTLIEGCDSSTGSVASSSCPVSIACGGSCCTATSYVSTCFTSTDCAGCTGAGPGSGGCYWDPALRGSCATEPYWSSTSATGMSDQENFVVAFSSADLTTLAVTRPARVRCVRNASPVAPQIGSFSASPAVAPSGTATVITWTWAYSNNPSPEPTCSIDNGVASVTNGGTTTVTITSDKVYTLTCTNAGGSSMATTTITLPVPTAPQIDSFSASPRGVVRGVATSVTWTWSYYAPPFPTPTCTIDNSVGTVTSGAQTFVTLTSNTTFNLSCSNGIGNPGTSSATIDLALGNLAGIGAGAYAYQTCAPVSTGGMMCWGADDSGQLGDGNSAEPSGSPPVQVAFSPSKTVAVQSVSAGYDHTCAVLANGAAQCWGSNNYGQVGDGVGDRLNVDAPVAVLNLTANVTSIAAGDWFTCAVALGNVTCWGEPSYCDLGSTQTTDILSPIAVSGLAAGNSTAVTAGDSHACALVSAGAWCWGHNGSGQVGNGASGSNVCSPVGVNGLSAGVAAIAAGADHTCALLSTGAVKCWGDNFYGQLGNGDTNGNGSATPVDVSGLSSGVTAVSVGGDHSCALLPGGAAKCWGDNSYGQLGNGDTNGNGSATPVGVNGLSSGVSAIAAGRNYTCALLTNGTAMCWGANGCAELGDGGSESLSFVPVAVAP